MRRYKAHYVNGKVTHWGAFCNHKSRAEARGIPFLLTFAEWLQIWIDSGHLHERGRHKGQYVMARFNDVGPYATWNVEIIKCEQNTHDGNAGKYRGPMSNDQKKKISEAKIGYKHTDETKERMSIAKIGCKLTEEHKSKISLAITGRKATEETKKRMSEANRRRWAKLSKEDRHTRALKASDTRRANQKLKQDNDNT